MTRTERLELIKKIEEQTNSKVLVFITGDRKGLETRISSDVIPFIYRHLEKFGSIPKINLLIYTTGGITISGYGIVNMIREHCKEYGIIVPFKCLSTGTLMALGANTVIMSKMGQLGPIDPSLDHPLGPKIQYLQNFTVKVPVNVEDVVSFFNLAKKEAKTKSEEEFTKILTILAGGIHPLVLGAVNRSRNEIRFLAKTLLEQHLTNKEDIDRIVKTLVEERFSHNYLIGRKEAKEVLKLNVIDTSEELIKNIMRLYNMYNEIMKLDIPYKKEMELGGNNEITVSFHRSIIESEHFIHTFTTDAIIKQFIVTDSQTGVQNSQYQSTIIKERWMKKDDI